jgi:hypothetical protein
MLWLTACCTDGPPEAVVDISALEEIRIDYQYMGWGQVEEHFTIAPASSEGGFVLSGRYETGSGGQVEVETILSSGQVGAFLRDLQAKAWTRVEGVHALAQRIDRATLREFEPVIRIPASRCTDGELQRLAKRHIGRARLEGLVDGYYGQGISWTDDYPFVTVHVARRGKPPFMMSSRSQKALMLPWDLGEPVDPPPHSSENWSLPASLSLQALLPPASHLYERLDGVSRMERGLNRQAMREAGRQCDAARSQETAG